MASVCCFCEKEHGGRPEMVEFEHDGLTISVWKSGMRCADCFRKRWIEKYEKMFRNDEKRFVFPGEDGRVTVDWIAYFRYFTGALGRRNREWQTEANEFLRDLGVLSQQAEGNWDIIGSGGMQLGPRTSGGAHLYFIREEDVIAYARKEFARAMYAWEIRQYGRTYDKGTIIREEDRRR